MPVVTYVNADSSDSRIKGWIAEIARTEIKLFPKARRDVRDVCLAIFAQILSVSVDHSRGVVIDSSLLFLIDRHDEHHTVLPRNILHQLHRRAVRDTFDRLVPTCLLLGTKI